MQKKLYKIYDKSDTTMNNKSQVKLSGNIAIIYE